MAYTFLDNSLTTRGVLTNKGGQKNNYWGDTITHEIATSQDVLTSVSLSVDKPTVNIDTTGNQKTWNHVIQGLSFNIDGIGAKVNENDYLIYQEGYNGRQYLMAITQVEESAVDSGIHYKTVQGLNAAAYDLSRKTLKPMTFAQNPNNNQTKGTPANILKYVFKDLSWDVRVIGNFGSVDYEITDGATSQSVLLDIISMFEAEVDGYIEKDNWQAGSNAFTNGGAIKRIFEFTSSLGHYKGQTIRYNKNLVSITKTGARDSMYTKLYVQGNNIDISDVNKGADFLVDDVANRKYNKLGAMSNPVTYLEGTIVNSSIDNQTALLAWGKKQLEILNHPRFNYSISATNDEEIQLGDTVIIQDTHASEPIFLKSKVISKNVSLADPFNNSFIVGEFSPIVIGADNGLEDTAQIMQLVNKANQTANDAIVKANENTQKIEDTRTNLEKTIDDKLQEGQDYADSLNDKAIEEQTKFNSKINQELATAKSERDALSTKGDQMIVSANSYADTMYSNAVAVAKTEASKALSDANTALDEAKTDLTTNLNKETEDRNKAVSAVNSQAQDYATQAKSDAIEAAKTADGKVRKDFKETADALSSTISQNKEDSDGKISTVKTTATQALNGLKTKVSQTDYNTKTGKLQTDLTETSQTANQAKTDIVAIKSEADSQSAQINDIVSDAKGTKQTISDIQTAQGKQSGSIATLKSRADGFDATVTKVNNLSVGGRNYILNSERTLSGSGNVQDTAWVFTSIPVSAFSNKTFTISVQVDYDNVTAVTGFGRIGIELTNNSVLPDGSNKTAYVGAWRKPVVGESFHGRVYATLDMSEVTLKNVYAENQWSNGLYIQGITGTNISVSKPKLEIGTKATDWTPAPEDLSSATAKAQLTADKANLDLSTYKTDADGRISKAQSDITATAKEVKTKVSQSDYDTKTNDLTKKYGQVKATADSVTTDVANYKKSNDGKVSANEAHIETLNNQITSKVSQTEFNETTGKLSGNYTETKQTVEKISNTVTELQAKANAQGQVNQLMNTEFSPDTENWEDGSDASSPKPYLTGVDGNVNGRVIGFRTGSTVNNTYARFLQWVSTGSDSPKISLSWMSYASAGITGKANIYLGFADSNGKMISSTQHSWINPGKSWDTYKWENISLPSGTRKIKVSFEAVGGVTAAYLGHPMLVFGSTVGDYVAGNYNNNARVAALEVDLNGITGLVNDPKKGLSATAALAANGLSVATTAKNAATTATQTAKGVQTKVEQMGGINLLINTEFNPDLEGWETNTTGTIKEPYRSYWQPNTQATTVGWATQSGSTSSYARLRQDVQLSTTPGSGHQISMSWYSYTGQTDFYNNIWLHFYDASGKSISKISTNWADLNGHNPSKQNSWNVQNKWEGIDVPDTAVMVNVSFEAREGTSAYLAHPMLVMGSTIGDYVAGNYNNNNSLQSTRTQLAGQITDEIEERKSGDKSVVTQTTRLIDQRVRSVTEGYESAISQSADTIMLSVSNNNLIPNSEFEPMGSKWYLFNDRSIGAIIGNELVGSTAMSPTAYYKDWSIVNGSQGIAYSTKDWYISELIRTNAGNVFSMSVLAGRSDSDNGPTGVFDFRLAFFDKNKKLLSLPKGTNPIQNVAKSDIRLYVNENITPPTGTYYVGFVLGHNSAVTDAIYQPMLNYGSKALKYTPTYGSNSESTILRLFKDNWAIGLADNVGKITNGIISDKNSLNLINNNIVLQGNTTVTQEFYAKGGNFKNLNASNITTGTIDAKKINVVNLDVKNLSGDVTNFIQSHWNGKFGSTTIDSSGITVSVPGSTSKFNSAGMETTFNKGSFVVRASTKDSGKSSGILLGMKDGATYTSFGFDSGSGYKDEMIITRTGSPAAELYNIGGGVAFNHNVSLMDNVYMKPGKGFFSVWGNENRAIFFNTINAGIPAIVSPSGAGLAFGHGGQLYLLSHGIYQNIDDKNDRGGFKFDHPNVLG